MSYTSVSMTRPGKAWDGVEPGSDEWAAMQEKQQASKAVGVYLT